MRSFKTLLYKKKQNSFMENLNFSMNDIQICHSSNWVNLLTHVEPRLIKTIYLINISKLNSFLQCCSSMEKCY